MVLKFLARSIAPSIVLMTLMKRKLVGFDMVTQFHGSWINFRNTGNPNKSGWAPMRRLRATVYLGTVNVLDPSSANDAISGYRKLQCRVWDEELGYIHNDFRRTTERRSNYVGISYVPCVILCFDILLLSRVHPLGFSNHNNSLRTPDFRNGFIFYVFEKNIVRFYFFDFSKILKRPRIPFSLCFSKMIAISFIKHIT